MRQELRQLLNYKNLVLLSSQQKSHMRRTRATPLGPRRLAIGALKLARGFALLLFLSGLVVLAGGWTLCYVSPPVARRLIVGGMMTAVSQVFPILHLILGVIALGIAGRLGSATPGDDVPIDKISSELGGFFVTLLVGGGLLICAGAIGLVLGWLLPARWFAPREAVNR